MKTAQVRDLRNQYNLLLRWVAEGEEVLIQKRGATVAMLVPSRPQPSGAVDWRQSAALQRDKKLWRKLNAKEASSLLQDFRGER
jgi:prevent-host-death family protein